MFRRRTSDAGSSDSAPSANGATAVTAEDLAKAARAAATAPKGRPTPKRSEAVAQRATLMNPPKDRREAAKLQRERARKARVESRAGLLSGDERYMTSRDRGPIRRFVRDYVDSRRTAGEYFFLVMLVIVAFTLFPNPSVQSLATAAFLAAVAVIVAEAFLISSRLRKGIDQRFPEEKGPYEGRKGAVFYGIMRELQLRRLRLPKPQVKPGATT